jgi:hypothetical protein
MMHRLNISDRNADAALQETIDRIAGAILVERAVGAASVEFAIKDATLHFSTDALSVDLVSHATDGVLGLGEWTVDDQGSMAKELRDHCAAELPQLQAGGIRLLGCNTAVTLAGQLAIQHLADVFQTEVSGATVPLYARDFGPDGLISTNVLADSSSLPKISDASGNMQAWFERFDPGPELKLSKMLDDLRQESLPDATRDWRRTHSTRRWPVQQLLSEYVFRSCFELVIPTLAAAPGLLALPERELLVPIADADDRYYRLTVLLGGYLVRVYRRSRPSSLILRAPLSLLGVLPTGAVLLPGKL